MSQYNKAETGVPQQHYYPPPPPPPSQQYPPPHKGTFEMDSNNPPPAPVFSAPQPGPPPAVWNLSAPHGYQVYQQQQPPPTTHVVIGAIPAATGPAELPCNGLGVGWLLFILGFLTGLTWYAGAIMLCTKIDRREKPGCIACTVAAVVNTIVIVIIIIAMAKEQHDFSQY